jgi:hypothetical protein
MASHTRSDASFSMPSSPIVDSATLMSIS